MQTEQKALTEKSRKYLIRKEIDMEEVYRELDRGKSLKEVALSLGVTTRTLYNHRKRYKEKLKRKAEKEIVQ